MSGLSQAARVIFGAIEAFQPRYIVSMVSGGRDSAASDAVLREVWGEPDLVIHGNTRCGIPETTEFVRAHYTSRPYAEADAGSAYEDYVLRKGFFGRGHSAHAFAYRVLKATPFRKVVSAELRQRRRNCSVLLINGARRLESANRAARLPVWRQDPAAPGNIWVNPLHWWSDAQRDAYLSSRAVPINPVATQLCRSGECMCGTMQSRAERAEAAALYPRWGRWIDGLEEEVFRRTRTLWGVHYSRVDARQGDLFMPMCTGCQNSGGAA